MGENGVEARKKLPRKFLRLAESFEAIHTHDVVFCIFYRKLFIICFFNKILHLKTLDYFLHSLSQNLLE